VYVGEAKCISVVFDLCLSIYANYDMIYATENVHLGISSELETILVLTNYIQS